MLYEARGEPANLPCELFISKNLKFWEICQQIFQKISSFKKRPDKFFNLLKI